MSSSEKLNQLCQNSLVSQLGIEITAINEQSVSGKMPVDQRTIQPFGLLHGGASLSLAETLASIGAMLTIDEKQQHCIALEINANHIKAVSSGYVYAQAIPKHLGKKTQVWSVEVVNDAQELVCISRLTVAILNNK